MNSAVGNTIAERGLAYFKQNKVRSLEKIKSTWFAQVEGSFPYYVKLTLNKQGNLSRAECTCPYEFRCKHIAAVWFAVLAQTEVIAPTIPNNIIAPSDDDLHIKELRDVCNRYAKGCDYWESRRFANDLEPFLDDLEYLSPETQFRLLKTFYNRVCTIIQRSDDSDGTLGGLLNESMFQLNRLYSQSQDSKLRKQIEQAWKKWIDNKEDFWLAKSCGITEFWQNAFYQAGRANEVLAWIEQHQQTADQYEQDQIAVWRYQALTHLDPQQASHFLQAHLNIPELRNLAVEALIDKQEYDKAENLLLSALQDKKRNFGYKKQWQESLLAIAEKNEQKDKIIAYAEKLVLDSDVNLHLSAYQSLKSACSAQQWQNETAKIEKYLLENNFEQKLAHFFTLENASDKLKSLLLSSQNISLISAYTVKVPKTEREQVVFHWLKLLEQSMQELRDRKKYAGWVRSANSLLKKYPYIHDELTRIADRFRQIYKHRTALMEELTMLNV